MVSEKKYPMTAAGKQKLEEELENMKIVTRVEVVERIKVARSHGDLSENSEYDAAKEDQAFVEGRISTLETMIRNAVIITEDHKTDEARLGSTVTFKEIPDGELETYTIVGSAEANPLEGLISNDSPIAKGILGGKKGQKVKITTPGGDMQVEITEIK